MAKKKKEEVAEVTTEEPKVLEITSEDKIKVKKPRKKKFENNDEVIKIDLSKPAETVENVTKVDTTENTIEEQPIVEITEETPSKPELPKQPDLPENIQKVVEFMKDTGGDLNDYMNLNKDFESIDNNVMGGINLSDFEMNL